MPIEITSPAHTLTNAKLSVVIRNRKFHEKLLECLSFHLHWTTTTQHYESHIFVHVLVFTFLLCTCSGHVHNSYCTHSSVDVRIQVSHIHQECQICAVVDTPQMLRHQYISYLVISNRQTDQNYCKNIRKFNIVNRHQI